jgi:hypothetical protein
LKCEFVYVGAQVPRTKTPAADVLGSFMVRDSLEISLSYNRGCDRFLQAECTG